MDLFARQSLEYGDEQGQYLLPDSKVEERISVDFKNERRRSSWAIIFPWIFSSVLLVGWIIEAAVPAGHPRLGYWTFGELGMSYVVHRS